MLLKLWWEIVGLSWAAWAIWKVARWTFQGVPMVECHRRVRERLAAVLEARRAAGA